MDIFACSLLQLNAESSSYSSSLCCVAHLHQLPDGSFSGRVVSFSYLRSFSSQILPAMLEAVIDPPHLCLHCLQVPCPPGQRTASLAHHGNASFFALDSCLLPLSRIKFSWTEVGCPDAAKVIRPGCSSSPCAIFHFYCEYLDTCSPSQV